MKISIRDWVGREDVFVLATHMAVGTFAAIAFDSAHELPAFAKVVFVLAYFTLAAVLYWWLKRTRLIGEKEVYETEIAKFRRYRLLQAEMLQVVGSFIKERYKVDSKLATKLNSLAVVPEINPMAAIEIMKEWDDQRREQIKSALGQICSSLVIDDFLKPKQADREVVDQFKVSFYEVTKDPLTNVEYLAPKWRYYPAEGAPTTRRFGRDEGAAGKAWSSKEIVVCEEGGNDPQFKGMYEGQKAKYASMICVPAIEDIPEEKMSEVYGVLTIDTPTRGRYFQESQKQFWASLMQPICSLLIYCRETERIKDAFLAIAHRYAADARGGIIAAGLVSGPDSEPKA